MSCFNCGIKENLINFVSVFKNDFEAYKYCYNCSQEKQKQDDEFISSITKSNLIKISDVVKEQYIKKYIQSPIEYYKEFKENDIDYVCFKKDDYLTLILALQNVNFNKLIHKVSTKQQENINLENSKIVNIDDYIENKEKRELEELERKRKKIYTLEIINKKQNKLVKELKEKAIEPFLNEPLPPNKELKAHLCKKCKSFKAYPFEFNKNIDKCDGCFENEPIQRKLYEIKCDCGVSYCNLSKSYEERHLRSKRHLDYEKYLLNDININFNNKKMNEIYDICKKNDISGFKQKKKNDLISIINELYKNNNLIL